MDGPILEHELELAEHQIPVLAPGVPMLLDALCGQIEHPAQGIIVCKTGFVFCDLPELPVQPLNDIGRVYDFPDFWRIFVKGA